MNFPLSNHVFRASKKQSTFQFADKTVGQPPMAERCRAEISARQMTTSAILSFATDERGRKVRLVCKFRSLWHSCTALLPGSTHAFVEFLQFCARNAHCASAYGHVIFCSTSPLQFLLANRSLGTPWHRRPSSSRALRAYLSCLAYY